MIKRRLLSVILVFCIILTTIMCVGAETPVAQTDIDTIAKVINKLGMLSGDGKGNYNLPSKLLRAEGCTFIVNMLGMSTFVNQNKGNLVNTGFGDVKSTDWYAANIGFCKQYKILEGYIENGNMMCGPTQFLTEKQFMAMLIRALGYTDVAWDNIYKTALQIGLVKDKSYEEKTGDEALFTRGDTVRLLYNALFLNKNGSNMSLIRELIKDGKVSQKVALEAGVITDQLPAEILGITAQSSEWIEVTLNESFNALSDSNIRIYDTQTKEILPFNINSQVDSKIRIKTTRQQPGQSYTVEISNITDLEGNLYDKISGKFSGYENKEIVSDLFKISKVEQTANNEVIVYFTHPINENAEVPEYYDILRGSDIIVKGNKATVEVKAINENAVKVSLKSYNLVEDTQYTVKVNGALIGAYGTNLGQNSGDEFKFIARKLESERFKVVGLSSITNKTIKLDFSKQLDFTAEQVFNYYITEMNTNTPIQVTKANIINGKSVVLALGTQMDSKKAYNILINIAYEAGRLNKIENEKYTFNGNDIISNDIQVKSIVPYDLNSIYVNFDREISESAATNVNNYSILCLSNTTYDVKPIKAVYSKKDPKGIRLYVSYDKPFVGDSIYRLRIGTAFQDSTGVALSKEIEHSFIANKIPKTKPEIVKAVFIASDTIKIEFNKDISLDAPNILTQNYYIQSAASTTNKKIPLGISYIDNRTIVLKFDKLDVIDQNYLVYKEIKDITGEVYPGSQINTPVFVGE